jgi:hypothetical protein
MNVPKAIVTDNGYKKRLTNLIYDKNIIARIRVKLCRTVNSKESGLV